MLMLFVDMGCNIDCPCSEFSAVSLPYRPQQKAFKQAVYGNVSSVGITSKSRRATWLQANSPRDTM